MIASTQIARLAPGSRRYSVIGSSAGLCSPCVILERVCDLIHIVWARQSVAAQAEVDGDQEQNIGGFSKLRFQVIKKPHFSIGGIWFALHQAERLLEISCVHRGRRIMYR